MHIFKSCLKNLLIKNKEDTIEDEKDNNWQYKPEAKPSRSKSHRINLIDCRWIISVTIEKTGWVKPKEEVAEYRED